ncbi:uncharacterized protein EI90DRAFT_2978613 [Cantharellus anzutake]|uniref:uncharacterized protein n=1 Tax=Cantharellus anzutake TaxID=1750568 RepID=UPI001905F7DD|nr:uncharacterized protein EI90DRAFT_2978613 [Cantharellus anzutake]KAF8319251.1 hypothetical protein EI90DRAFT_2978613 [Cantharellus anzutake]
MATRGRRRQQTAKGNQTTLSSFYGGNKSRSQQVASNDSLDGAQIAEESPLLTGDPNVTSGERVGGERVGSEDDVPSPPSAPHSGLPSIEKKVHFRSGRRLVSLLDLPVLELPSSCRRVGGAEKIQILKPQQSKVAGPLDRLFRDTAGSSIEESAPDPLPDIRPSTPEVQPRGSPAPARQESYSREVSILEVDPPKSSPFERPITISDSPAPSIRQTTRTTHPFFLSKKSKSLANEVIHTEDDTIDLTQSPVKSLSHSEQKLPRFKARFAPREAPWPSPGMQHIQSLSKDPLSAMTCPFPPRHIQKHESVPSPPFTFPSSNPTPPPSPQTSLHLEHRPPSNSIPDEHLMHPALSRLRACRSESWQFAHASQQWVDKYKPNRANQVLGNELNAQYIKEWLLALRVTFQGGSSSRGKRPRTTIRQAVDKVQERAKKRRKKHSDAYGDEDWIVDTDGEEDIPQSDVDSFREDSYLSSPVRSTPGPRASRQPPELSPTFDFSTNLSSALLLTGPHGSGKTAAVYACAQELGWEVFEVNPGTGKRSGSLLASFAEGVGKNHTLKSSNTRQTDCASEVETKKDDCAESD